MGAIEDLYAFYYNNPHRNTDLTERYTAGFMDMQSHTTKEIIELLLEVYKDDFYFQGIRPK